MTIQIILVHILQIQSQSVLICLVNVTLTAKSALITSQFASHTVAIYHTIVGLETLTDKTHRDQG